MENSHKTSNLVWNTVPDITFFKKNDISVIVAEIGCQTLKQVRSIKILRNTSKQVPLSNLNIYPNVVLELASETSQNDLIRVASPFDKTVKMITFSHLTALSIKMNLECVIWAQKRSCWQSL